MLVKNNTLQKGDANYFFNRYGGIVTNTLFDMIHLPFLIPYLFGCMTRFKLLKQKHTIRL